jgi:hypothetical protein
MPYSEYRGELAVTGWIILFLSAVLAAIYYSYYDLDYFWTFIYIAAGPFAYWLIWADLGFRVDSLFVWVPIISVNIWAVFRALRTTVATSRRRRLALAASIWLISGFISVRVLIEQI